MIAYLISHVVSIIIQQLHVISFFTWFRLEIAIHTNIVLKVGEGFGYKKKTQKDYSRSMSKVPT